MSPTARGLTSMIVACTIWGLSPIYYKGLAPVPPLEVLAHRTLWSLVFFAGWLAMRGRMGQLTAALRGATARIALAAVLIAMNWFGFIHAIQIGRTIESSLGYYIFPLVAVVLGLVVFRDRFRRAQWAAVALAAVAVVGLTLGLGVVPVIPLGLAVTFGLYGMLKKQLDVPATVSVTAEVALLAPLALGWLALVHGAGWTDMTGRAGAVFGADLGLSLLLILSGPLTALPLILVSAASRVLSLPTLGLTQYLNPTLQFLCATAVFGEPVTPWHLGAFVLIWTALAIYSADGIRAARRARAPFVAGS